MAGQTEVGLEVGAGVGFVGVAVVGGIECVGGAVSVGAAVGAQFEHPAQLQP